VKSSPGFFTPRREVREENVRLVDLVGPEQFHAVQAAAKARPEGAVGDVHRLATSLRALHWLHFIVSLRHRAAHYALKASATAFGFLAATLSKARAGPSGVLRPCSQFFSVATLTPIIKANSACDFPSFRRIDLMSAGLNVKTRLGFMLPRRIRPAWRTLLVRS